MGILEKRDAMVAEYCGGKVLSMDEIRESFSHHMPHEALQPLPKPCADCAVTGGLYHQVSAMLSLLPADEVKFHSDRWFCHNHCNRACRGNINYQRAVAVTNGVRNHD